MKEAGAAGCELPFCHSPHSPWRELVWESCSVLLLSGPLHEDTCANVCLSNLHARRCGALAVLLCLESQLLGPLHAIAARGLE